MRTNLIGSDDPGGPLLFFGFEASGIYSIYWFYHTRGPPGFDDITSRALVKAARLRPLIYGKKVISLVDQIENEFLRGPPG